MATPRRVYCSCLNTSIHVGDVHGLDTAATSWLTPHLQAPSTTWQKTTLGMGGAKVRVESLGGAQNLSNGWQMYTLHKCLNCEMETHVSPIGFSSAAPFLINAALLDQRAADVLQQRSPPFSPTFGMVIQSCPQVADAHAPDLSEKEAAAAFAFIQKSIQDYLVFEEQAMNQRIAAFEQQEKAQLALRRSQAYSDRKLLWQKLRHVINQKRAHESPTGATPGPDTSQPAPPVPLQPAELVSVSLSPSAAKHVPASPLRHGRSRESPLRTPEDKPAPVTSELPLDSPIRPRAPSHPAPPPPPTNSTGESQSPISRRNTETSEPSAFFVFDDMARPNDEPLEISDFEDDVDDPANSLEEEDDAHRVQTTLPQFQACSLPVQVPARFSAWKPREAPKPAPAKASVSPNPPAHQPNLLSSSLSAGGSALPPAAGTSSSNTLQAVTDGSEPDSTGPLVDAFGLVPQELSEDEQGFVVPYELVIQQENADELSRSFAVPLSLTRSRPGFL